MSLMGNLGFNNYDRSQEVAGAGAPKPKRRETEIMDMIKDEEREEEKTKARRSSAASRRGSVKSQSHPVLSPATTQRQDGKDPEKAVISSPDSITRSHPTEEVESPSMSRLSTDEIKGKSDSDDIDSEEEERDAAVTDLARHITNRSIASGAAGEDESPFAPQPGSALDPSSDSFSARAWAKAIMRLLSRDPDKFKQRTAGIAFRNLNVYGFGASTDYQKSVGNVVFEVSGLARRLMGQGPRRIDILRDFEGLVEHGEMLVVLGPPGSGCSTLLKTIAGETHGLSVEEGSHLNFQGISYKDMQKKFRGEALYTAEVDVHFPQLTVGDTLSFAARARAPRHIPGGISRKEYADFMRDVTMATFGIGHTVNTRVGNDYVRGVSGGERKRVTISEAALSGAPLTCWDNSTRGLDSANAIEFCKTLRHASEICGTTACVAIYQAPQAAYDLFDKVVVLYEGRQIFFGRTTDAKQYFVNLGFECPERATTADFCTSMTSPDERVVRPGFEDRTPRTPDEFAKAWKESTERKRLLQQIEEFDKEYEVGGPHLEKFKESRRTQQAKHQRVSSPYTLSYSQQVRLCLWRGICRVKADPSLTIAQLFGNMVSALIIGSVFYNLQDTTSTFYTRGSLLFFAVLTNAFGSALEILTLYAQRPIVEKHARYALYHPSAEAFASMLTDLPFKVLNAIAFNLVIYFMTNLRREPGAFFFFLLVSFLLTLAMSMLFRTIASVSRTLAQAMAPTSILILAIVIFTGFVIPVDYMLGWCRWINYVDPVAYGFEALMINEFTRRNFTCSALVPSGAQLGYGDISGVNQACNTIGSILGEPLVDGDAYINTAFRYYASNKWRNVGIIIVFVIFLLGTYLVSAEFVSAKKSKGEVLVFRRGHTPAALTKTSPDDVEAASKGLAKSATAKSDHVAMIQKQTAVFHWNDVCYDIKIKNEQRRILDHVDGWVKPGTLTALMGVSGAGKTTLLDVLASRVTMGVITGEMLVDGRPRDTSFQRKTGYVQQQDLHLSTSTVREALNFSALLRQPRHISRKEKLDYVTEVIRLLEMEEYADAVVGVPGEGLNVEQRKRLTIGVELAAKPQLLLFLDEPTSGLDSQTSMAICDLMEKLSKESQQAVLFTIHQPSAMLFQRFDRLLFLAKGGKTVYFGDIGESSSTMRSYFERNGGFPCPAGANPAEWMLEVIGAAPGSTSDIDWYQTWRGSPEYADVQRELRELKEAGAGLARQPTGNEREGKNAYREFAAPFAVQFWEVTKRVFQQYWRTPSFIYSKAALCTLTALFIGLVFFDARNTMQGLQNQMLAIFMLLTIFNQLGQQTMPHFVTQRSLYEVRERPSKTYAWQSFMLSNIIVEIPWNVLMAILIYVCWYYPVGLYRNAAYTDATTERGAQMFLLLLAFLLHASTFTNMVIAGVETAEAGGNISNLMFSLSLIFCGVIAGPSTLPGFWIFMYRVSPFTYLVSGLLSTAVARAPLRCSDAELLRFAPRANQTCGEYMRPWVAASGGYVADPAARESCEFCLIDNTDAFLQGVSISYDDSWRNFGLMWVYIAFNVAAALGLYWLLRVPKKKAGKKSKKE